MKKYYLIILCFSLFSCGVFKENHQNFQKINLQNVKKLEGTYSMFSRKKPDKYYYKDNLNEKFYRKFGREEMDTINFDTIKGGKLKLYILNDKKLILDFEDNTKTLKSQQLEYKFKKDGFLYIKNKNTLTS